MEPTVTYRVVLTYEAPAVNELFEAAIDKQYGENRLGSGYCFNGNTRDIEYEFDSHEALMIAVDHMKNVARITNVVVDIVPSRHLYDNDAEVDACERVARATDHTGLMFNFMSSGWNPR